MRSPPYFSVVIWFLFFGAIRAEASTSFGDVLQSDQVFIIAQHDRYRWAERIESTATCPKLMSQPKSKVETKFREIVPDLTFYFVGFHLVRDPTGDLPPRLLVIKEEQMAFNIDLIDLNNTSVFTSKVTPSLDSDLDENLYVLAYRNHNRATKPKEVKSQSIYDTVNNMLYLFHYKDEKYDVNSYFIRGSTQKNFFPQGLERFHEKPSTYRFDWVEDPYSGTVYYKEVVANETLLFKGATSDFIYLLFCTKSGSFVSKVPPNQKIQGVSQGVIYGINEGENNTTAKNQSFIVSYEMQSEVICDITTPGKDMPVNNKLLIVRGYDFCMLRDGSNYNKTECEREQSQFTKNRFADGEPFNAILWLMIFSIFLVILVTLQCIYIYWLRSTFVSADERDGQNENETEASIFIAKQRSFPTSYQDPAVLDMSVDKWN